jgi:putative membrane protein
MEHLLWQILSSVLFSSLGLVILLAAYYVVEKLTPENTWKEIVENKNVALAIVFGAFIIGIAIIISGAIHG